MRVTATFGQVRIIREQVAHWNAVRSGETAMRWSSGGESEDIEDRRDDGGGGGFQFGGMHMGIGGAIILLILSFIFKTNLFTLLSGGAGDSGPAAVRQPDKARD